jgi:prevent-host-death family protein
MQMNIAGAMAKLSNLMAAVERGEDVAIARGGAPVARIVPATHGRAFRIGMAAGAIARCPDFLAPMADKDLRSRE